MVDTQRIRQAIEALYVDSYGPTVPVPLSVQAQDLAYFARDYLAAATTLDGSPTQHWLPMLQITGHAVELSLKACMAAAQAIPPIGHDLLALYGQAEHFGFALDEAQYATIVHLQHFYFTDLATGTRFKARYPSRTTESLGGAVPSNAAYVSVVTSLLAQATDRLR